ncbi:MAG TPA: helix-hairpin-helix domain-containing protein [Candidatus Kapabacteria bacterium]|nr:helix-hairpin-helix domain-containing protein [Candidatus Kapabacteria bacterium]
MTICKKEVSRRRGIALIIVMIVIVMLAVLAGGFAYSMKVETRLARNSSFDADMENLGRSGVEYARWILAEQLRETNPEQRAYTGLNQKWADGPANTNEPLVHVDMNYNELPPGIFSMRITDMERKFNLSSIRDERFSPVLQRALETLGAETIQTTEIVESYLDWVDPDDNKRMQGAESDFYETLNPAAPYVAKNGLMDDVSEFLLIRGMTPDLFFGAPRAALMPRFGAAPKTTSLGGGPPTTGTQSAVGLVDLFTTISSAGMAVNVNTASAEVLQLLPGMDEALARSIIDTRAGPDHEDGTYDDIPFLRQGELINVPGMVPEVMSAMGRYLVVNSSIFTVVVEVKIGEFVKRYEALLQRRNAQDITILYFRVL